MYYVLKIKQFFIKSWRKFFLLVLPAYCRFLSLFLRFKRKVHSLEFSEPPVSLKEYALKLPKPRVEKLRPTYAFIRRLEFYPKVNIHKMRDFKSLLKWNRLNLDYPVVIRNYPLGFTANLGRLDGSKLEIKVPPKVLSVERGDFHIPDRLKTYEEIVKILPYVKKSGHKKIFKIPITKEPLVKHQFSREQMRIIREKIAKQNKTSWLNIQIYEIYDKFCPNLYVNVKQASGSKSLECSLSFLASGKNPSKTYYLAIGQRRDNGQSINAIVDPEDIKKAEDG